MSVGRPTTVGRRITIGLRVVTERLGELGHDDASQTGRADVLLHRDRPRGDAGQDRRPGDRELGPAGQPVPHDEHEPEVYIALLT